MYYHEISFLPQFRFLLYSLMTGFADGLLCSMLCNKAIAKKVLYITDFLFCIASVFIILCVNIGFQESALRVYEVLGFILGLCIYIFFIKKYTDRLFGAVYSFIIKVTVSPLKALFKIISDKSNLILKRVHILVYNLKKRITENKEKTLNNGKHKKKEKKKKGKTAQ